MLKQIILLRYCSIHLYAPQVGDTIVCSFGSQIRLVRYYKQINIRTIHQTIFSTIISWKWVLSFGCFGSYNIYYILQRWGSPCLLTRWTRERKSSQFWLWCNDNLGCDLVTIAVVILWPRLPYCDNLGCDTMTIPVVIQWQSRLWYSDNRGCDTMTIPVVNLINAQEVGVLDK